MGSNIVEPAGTGLITAAHHEQYRQEGYFIAEKVISDEHLQILRDACDHLIEAMHREMDARGVDHIHISHCGKRYHIAKQYQQAPRLEEYVFGELMAEVCWAIIGDTAFLFYDQYVVKAAENMKFSWHQDSGYLGFPHREYVTVWAAVDDMTLENGTAYVLPYSKVGIRTLVEHVRDPESGDKCGYFGDEPGVAAVVSAGSLVVFSSLIFHRSGFKPPTGCVVPTSPNILPSRFISPAPSGPTALVSRCIWRCHSCERERMFLRPLLLRR